MPIVRLKMCSNTSQVCRDELGLSGFQYCPFYRLFPETSQMREFQILGDSVLDPTYCEAYRNIHISRQNCGGLSETPMYAIALPSFAHRVRQSPLPSYTKRDLYGEMPLHTSCLPNHAALHLFTQLITFNISIQSSRITIAVLP
jgi:hypothetical protein